ncbi:MAG: hypothetical protein A2W31_09525 [Planctomycetes bacterium RBG_16_64_10]|nr:MAG: hypothetical protein A2W31_09525 [Planctomycetes bacterium RBG_16_64_10]
MGRRGTVDIHIGRLGEPGVPFMRGRDVGTINATNITGVTDVTDMTDVTAMTDVAEMTDVADTTEVTAIMAKPQEGQCELDDHHRAADHGTE